MCSLGIVLKLKNKTLKQSVIFASHRILWRRLVWHTSQWFYWINDGNPHLQSPSLENSSAPTVRSGPVINSEKSVQMVVLPYTTMINWPQCALTRVPRVNDCVWGEWWGKKHVQIHRGGGWEVKKWMKSVFLCLCHSTQHGLFDPPASSPGP